MAQGIRPCGGLGCGGLVVGAVFEIEEPEVIIVLSMQVALYVITCIINRAGKNVVVIILSSNHER